MRKTDEWIADHDDQEIPKRVKLRIFEREGGKCYLTGHKIRPGDKFEYEHVIALAHGGQHRESNIRLAMADAHKSKTALDVNIKAKIDRIRAKHLGLTKPKRRGFDKRISRRMDGSVVRREP